MPPLSPKDLFALEDYSIRRDDYRAKVMEHKKHRRVALGPNAHLSFEDRLNIQYQVQEMLRIEKIFDQQGIAEELEAYNPLIPDGSNWKATFMLEYPDPEVRKNALAQLVGIEKAVYVQIQHHDKVRPICNEDLDRTTDEKTSSVHFMRFELDREIIEDLKAGAALTMGCDHINYNFKVTVDKDTKASLIADLT